MLSRVQQTDAAVPVQRGAWYTYTRMEEGKAYVFHCRRSAAGATTTPRSPEELGSAAEQLVLNVNALADGQSHCEVRSLQYSPSGDLVAFGVDFAGNETFEIRFRRIAADGSIADLDDVLEKTTGETVWGADDRCVFYLTVDDEWRPHKLWRHVLGTPQSTDELVYHERDKLFWMGIDKTLSDRFFVLETSAKDTSEIRVLDLSEPAVEGGCAAGIGERFRVIEPRTPGLRYELAHRGDTWIVVHNGDGRKNSVLATAPIASPGRASWRDLIPYEPLTEVRVIGNQSPCVLCEPLPSCGLETGRFGMCKASATLWQWRAGRKACHKCGF